MKSTRGSVAPAVVAQRLCDLLLQFPSAALGGVQWRVLVKKYEERYSTQLKIGNLGHSSPIAAATALLWDVLRVVDTSDPDNPKLGVEDAVVLTPRPGFMGSWPSLYRHSVLLLKAAVQLKHSPWQLRQMAAPSQWFAACCFHNLNLCCKQLGTPTSTKTAWVSLMKRDLL